ncbi:neutral zinc metallopeptidase [Marinactinospora rubrisoli]|uniref:Neutral zinc metallopeptidase n=1 Tax=Marinactinospora rubrisoli TaxID=2715399 RepID=A0ABW2KDY7_9ACTN
MDTPLAAPPGPEPGAERPSAPPPVPRPRTPAPVLIAAGGSAVAALVALVICVALVISSLNTPAASAAYKPSGAIPHHPHPRPAAQVVLDEHPVYELPGPRSTTCADPRLDPDSAASWEDFNAEIGDCLDEAWFPTLSDLGVRPASPTLVVLDENDVDSEDEEGMTLAYYDDADQTINVLLPSVSEMSEGVPGAEDEGVWVALLAHEYGHHVQAQVGILDRSYVEEEKAESEEAGLEMLRRTELQAECFGGAALRALGLFTDREADAINEVFNGGSDLETHGTEDNRMYWFLQGWNGSTVEDCNTYGADERLVK